MTEEFPRVAVFLSGGGTGLLAFIDAVAMGQLRANLALVVSSKRKAFGLERAAQAGIDSFVVKPSKYPTPEDAADDLMDRLRSHKIEYIALSGYLSLLPAEVVREYRGRITNIHPALLPKYGGHGMYGHFVHEAVLASGDKESGCTVHLVDEIYDNGRILAQSKVPVMPDDTPDSLAARVLIEEHKLYPKVLDQLIHGEFE